MDIQQETRFFDCTCGCNAIAVTNSPDPAEIIIEVWEPRGSRTTFGYRLKQAWRVLRGLGSMDETILTMENARYLGLHLLQVTAGEEGDEPIKDLSKLPYGKGTILLKGGSAV